MKLIDCQEEGLGAGAIFRFKGKYPFEEVVDFMLVYNPGSESRYMLICASGYYTGETELMLPKEAKNENEVSISTSWLIKNWNKWIYPHCPVQDVLLIRKNQVPLWEE